MQFSIWAEIQIFLPTSCKYRTHYSLIMICFTLLLQRYVL